MEVALAPPLTLPTVAFEDSRQGCRPVRAVFNGVGRPSNWNALQVGSNGLAKFCAHEPFGNPGKYWDASRWPVILR